MIDLHSHILNQVDDGAKNIQMSLDMLKVSESIGVTKVVLTPHYGKGKYSTSLGEVMSRFSSLKNAAKENNINIKLYLVELLGNELPRFFFLN